MARVSSLSWGAANACGLSLPTRAQRLGWRFALVHGAQKRINLDPECPGQAVQNTDRWVHGAALDAAQVWRGYSRVDRQGLLRDCAVGSKPTQVPGEPSPSIHPAWARGLDALIHDVYDNDYLMAAASQKEGIAMNAYMSAMRNYAVFRGRASRSEFWLFYLFFLLLSIVAALLDLALGTANPKGGPLLAIVYLAHLLPQLAVGVRRLHDSDHSGWWWWLPPIFFIFCFFPSTPGPNRFGPAPSAGSAGASPGPTAGSPAGGIPAASDPILEIERLAQLRASGSLSDVEFEVLKAKALARPRSP